MRTIGHYIRVIIRFIVVWFVDAISILITAWIIPGFSIEQVGDTPVLVVATAAAFVLGIVNLLIRPLLLLLTLPFGWMVIFAAGFFINAITLMLTAYLLPGLDISSWWVAFFGGLFLSFVNTVISTLLAIDDDESFYQNLVERSAVRQAGDIEQNDIRGLVIIETDGLSYQRIHKAIADGYMPTIKKMIEEDGYQISRIDCGMPPTTPACQAGILHGNNNNIPAFRWLDKNTGEILEGGKAAPAIETEISDGNGILRGGTSIGNFFSGDAEKSLLVFSKLKTGSEKDQKQRARDMFLLMRNPYFFVRVLILVFADVTQEIWQGWQQRRKDVQPRLNRLHNGYPLLRAAVNVFLREIGTYFTILDIVRGVPAMYTLYAGYDEIAHHSGPYTHDCDLSLQQFDKQLARIKRTIDEKAKRPFEIILLSDHGQSFGPTFKQRYGFSILEFIEQQMPHGTSVSGSGGGDDGTIGVSAMMHELNNMQEQEQGGTVGKAAINQAHKLIENNLAQQDSFQEAAPAQVTLAYGGNGAHVYFDLFPRKITLNELNSAYPGMVDNVVQHEGIGFVIAFEDDLTPVAFGKNGARNLVNGIVVGEDPLLPFGDVELRSWQLRRMADFENSGDLILNSTLYPDGTVASLEELIGSHGGLGGEQTDAYMFHPGDMVVPETRNSYEFKYILDTRRDLEGPTPKPEKPEEEHVDGWALSTMARGISQVGKWISYVAQAITLNREGFRSIGQDVYMNAPALLIALLSTILQSINTENGMNIISISLRYTVWLLSVLFMYIAARILRGEADFSTTLRAMGFAQSGHFLELLGFIPVVGVLARFAALVISLFGTWMGTAGVHNIKGWRTLILPVIYLAVTIISFVFLISVIEGTIFSVDSLIQDFGLNSGN